MSTSTKDHTITAFRPVPRTGVIYVTSEANARGYRSSAPDWCNLGQGQPETGPLPGSPERMTNVPLLPFDQEYAPPSGLMEVRDAVASLYNALYRRGMKSQYSAENVCIAGGGRASLTRAAASLGPVNLGHFLPDYTAYEELLDIFKAFTSIPILLDADKGYHFSADDLRREVMGRGLGAILFSNPANPTGKHVRGDELQDWVGVARELDCALLVDEFYSHYVYDDAPNAEPMESAARYVEDVNRDPVVLFDGFTKNWRYPGWRVTWAVGPKSVVESLGSAGSFLDGGGSRPLQRAALPLLTEEHARAEARAIQTAFRKKRDVAVEGLRSIGVKLDMIPQGTFYCWGSVASLPPKIADGMSFFRAALEQKVITVPGVFFDVNPGKRRRAGRSRFTGHVRFSFGPELGVVEEALRRLKGIVQAADG